MIFNFIPVATSVATGIKKPTIETFRSFEEKNIIVAK